MHDVTDALSPLIRLFIAYAPVPLRASWTVLHQFDHRFAQIYFNSSEPFLGQLRLKWWQEQLTSFVEGSATQAGAHVPGGEPLLESLVRLGDAGSATAKAAAILTEAWGDLLSAETDADVLRWAETRASALVTPFALPHDSHGRAGQILSGWALWQIADCTPIADRAHIHSLARPRLERNATGLPRPVAMMRACARRDAARGGAGQGRPLRLLLPIVWAGLTGR